MRFAPVRKKTARCETPPAGACHESMRSTCLSPKIDQCDISCLRLKLKLSSGLASQKHLFGSAPVKTRATRTRPPHTHLCGLHAEPSDGAVREAPGGALLPVGRHECLVRPHSNDLPLVVHRHLPHRPLDLCADRNGRWDTVLRKVIDEGERRAERRLLRTMPDILGRFVRYYGGKKEGLSAQG